jgi:hypothetical protein
VERNEELREGGGGGVGDRKTEIATVFTREKEIEGNAL